MSPMSSCSRPLQGTSRCTSPPSLTRRRPTWTSPALTTPSAPSRSRTGQYVYQPPGGGQPPYGTPQPFYPQQPPPSRANGPLIAAIGCGALVIIGALVAVLVILVS